MKLTRPTALLIVTLAAVLAAFSVPASAKITPNGVSQGELVELLNDLVDASYKNTCRHVGALTDNGSGTGVGFTSGTIGVMINGVPYYKAPATTAFSGTAITGHATKFKVMPVVLGVNSSGTISFTQGTAGTGTTKALAQAASVMPAMASGVIPFGVCIVTVNPPLAGQSALVFTPGTTSTGTSEIFALVGGSSSTPSMSPVTDSGL